MGNSQADLNKQLSSLTPDTLIDLYEINFSNLQTNFEMLEDLYGINIGADAIYRFCPMINGTNPIVWQGNSYQPLPVKMDGFEQKSDGRLPRPTMTIANPEGIFSKIVHSNKDFSNCKVTRKRTYARFLDDENFQNRNLNAAGQNPFGEADPNSHLPDDVYFINKKSQENRKYIQFELVSSLELENSPVPARVVLSSYCNWTYRCNIGCNYKGLPIEDIDGKSLRSGFGFFGGGEVDPNLYPNGIEDIAEWNKFGKNGSSDNLTGYQDGDLVKIINKSSGDPYKKIPQVFVCIQSHTSAKDHHPFFDKEFWLKDECQKDLNACKKRFSSKSELLAYSKADNSPGLRFGGFPGTEKFPVE
jgi:lambda family phage minor tail protein L